MAILLGILSIQVLVIIRSKMGAERGTPYLTVFVLSVILVGYFLSMAYLALGEQ